MFAQPGRAPSTRIVQELARGEAGIDILEVSTDYTDDTDDSMQWEAST
jgi:hypothetical protein